jgi:hypothetical protein
MDRREWGRKVIPSCARQAQEAVAQLRAQGIRASHERDWLRLDLLVDQGEELEDLAEGLLNRVWPAWRSCVADRRRAHGSSG